MGVSSYDQQNSKKGSERDVSSCVPVAFNGLSSARVLSDPTPPALRTLDRGHLAAPCSVPVSCDMIWSSPSWMGRWLRM
jgi:hypothetical protein